MAPVLTVVRKRRLPSVEESAIRKIIPMVRAKPWPCQGHRSSAAIYLGRTPMKGKMSTSSCGRMNLFGPRCPPINSTMEIRSNPARCFPALSCYSAASRAHRNCCLIRNWAAYSTEHPECCFRWLLIHPVWYCKATVVDLDCKATVAAEVSASVGVDYSAASCFQNWPLLLLQPPDSTPWEQVTWDEQVLRCRYRGRYPSPTNHSDRNRQE